MAQLKFDGGEIDNCIVRYLWAECVTRRCVAVVHSFLLSIECQLDGCTNSSTLILLRMYLGRLHAAFSATQLVDSTCQLSVDPCLLGPTRFNPDGER